LSFNGYQEQAGNPRYPPVLPEKGQCQLFAQSGSIQGDTHNRAPFSIGQNFVVVADRPLEEANLWGGIHNAVLQFDSTQRHIIGIENDAPIILHYKAIEVSELRTV
jgi:hypothetical protein